VPDVINRVDGTQDTEVLLQLFWRQGFAGFNGIRMLAQTHEVAGAGHPHHQDISLDSLFYPGQNPPTVPP